MNAFGRKLLIVIIVLMLFAGLIAYRYRIFPFNRGNGLTCSAGQYARMCKLGPCCCPIGAICD